ncbi:MAG TPA: hypothetical protein VGF48_20080 [Thermoanaerobaculia bacterium]|jgi:hypothetical protein
MKVLTVPQNAYGEATDSVNRLLQVAQHFKWFPPVANDNAEYMVVRHADLLAKFGITAREGDVHVVTGDLREAARIYRAANPVSSTDDPIYARGRWRSRISDIFAPVASNAARDEVKPRFGPPLFPIAGNALVCGATLVADRDELLRLVNDPEYRATIWYLMCDVESDFWNAIAAEIAGEEQIKDAFAGLIDLYANGYYPLGFVADRFVTFVLKK